MRFHGLALACAVLAGSTLACGGDSGRPKTFSTDWVDDGGKSMEAVQARLRGARPAPAADLVVSVVGKDKFVGTPLGGGAAWTATHALDTRPIIAGNVVIVSGGNEVAAFDAVKGTKLWARPTGGLPVLGAGDDGNLTAVTLSRGNGSTLLVVGRDGAVKRQIETDKSVGAPAVIAGVILAPWAGQYVSAIDAATGEELGRAVVRDKVSRAITFGGSVWFGEGALLRFDDKLGQATRGQATRLVIPPRELPGTPRLLVPGTEKISPEANARDRARLFARPAGDAAPAFDSGRFYASYYHLALGFGAKDGRLAWVRTNGSDFVGGEAAPGGVVLCDESGKLLVLDAQSGQIAQELSVGSPIMSCVVQADSYRVPPAKTAAPPLVAQIAEAVTTREATLAAAQRLLLKELAALEDESATKTLIDIASDPRAVPVMLADARAALASRRNGASFMLAALDRHYDFIHDVLSSPPVGPLADALAAMKETRAAPLLAQQLFEPQITNDDVKRAAAALVVLATNKELSSLKQFFAMYRGTASADEIALAVVSVGEAMLRIDPKASRSLVEAATKDSITVPAARARLEALLAKSSESH